MWVQDELCALHEYIMYCFVFPRGPTVVVRESCVSEWQLLMSSCDSRQVAEPWLPNLSCPSALRESVVTWVPSERQWTGVWPAESLGLEGLRAPLKHLPQCQQQPATVLLRRDRTPLLPYCVEYLTMHINNTERIPALLKHWYYRLLRKWKIIFVIKLDKHFGQ